MIKVMHPVALTMLDCVNQIDFVEDRVQPLTWSEDSAALLKLCLDRKMLSIPDLCPVISNSLVACGRRCYRQHVRSLSIFSRSVVYPDHVISPQALAFAIRDGKIRDKELERIRFDSDENIPTFMSMLSMELVDNILNQLLEWKNPVFTERQRSTKFDPNDIS